jgi:hypothetical protein
MPSRRSVAVLVALLVGCSGSLAPRDGSAPAERDSGARDAGARDAETAGELRIVPEALAMRPGASARFRAQLADGASAAVSWSIAEDGGGSIDADGFYRAPDSTGTFHIVAESDSASASATVTVVEIGGCEGLPEPGVWENITPPGSVEGAVNGTVGAAIVVDPHDPRTVWLGTGIENDEIWRSGDCGANWTRVNTGEGSGVGDGSQWSMVVDPVDPGVIYAVSGYGAQSLWKTIDGGVNWVDVLRGTEYNEVAKYRFANNVSMDPSDHLHLIVTTHGLCLEPYAPSCMAETFDGGEHWRTFTAPEAWVEGGGAMIVAGPHWVWCGSELLVTRDAGEVWTPGLEGGGTCESQYTIRPFVPAANGNYYLGTRNGVIRSADGVSWERVGDTSGFMVMIALSSTRVYAANQWAPSIRWASLEDDEVWEELGAPPQIGEDGGIPFLAYDEAHHIAYASMYPGGVARIVVEE